jgi:hypothetical protein
MRKFFWTVWGINTVALAWLLGSLLLTGSTPSRTDMAGDLAEIWAGLAAIAGCCLRRSEKQRTSSCII